MWSLRLNTCCKVILMALCIFVGSSDISAKGQAGGYLRKFVGSMSASPVTSKLLQVAPHTTANHIDGVISGTDFEISVYVRWQPVGQPIVDPGGLDNIELYITGPANTGMDVRDRKIAYHDWTGVAGIHPSWWTIGATIDTTEFKTGRVVTITARGKAHTQGYVITPTSWRLLVVNSPLFSGNEGLAADVAPTDFPRYYVDSVHNIDTNLEAAGYGYLPDSVPDRSTLLAALPQNTVFITVTHGNLDEFHYYSSRFCTLHQPGHGGTPPAQQVLPGLVATAIQKKSKVEPRNPPYSFAFFDACLVFGDIVNLGPGNLDTHMASAILEGDPEAALPSPNSGDRDRCALGYQWTIACTDATSGFAEAIMRDMAHHYRTIEEAVKYGLKDGPDAFIKNVPVGQRPVIGKVQPHIAGDRTMTLHGLYGKPTNPRDQSVYVNDARNYVWSWQIVDRPYTGPE